MTRDSYAEVGAATRRLVNAALGAELAPFDLRVALVVVRELTTWSRLADDVPLGVLTAAVYQSSDVAEWQRRKVSKALTRLTAAGVLERTPTPPGRPAGGRGAVLSIALPTGPEPARIPDPNPADTGPVTPVDNPDFNRAESSPVSAKPGSSRRETGLKPVAKPGSSQPPLTRSNTREEPRGPNPPQPSPVTNGAQPDPVCPDLDIWQRSHAAAERLTDPHPPPAPTPDRRRHLRAVT